MRARTPYKIQIRIQDIGDVPLQLFLLSIPQCLLELGKVRLIDSTQFKRMMMMTISDRNLREQVCRELEGTEECVIANIAVPEAWFADAIVGNVFSWLVMLTKKTNQSDGLKRAFQKRKERTRGLQATHHASPDS